MNKYNNFGTVVKLWGGGFAAEWYGTDNVLQVKSGLASRKEANAVLKDAKATVVTARAFAKMSQFRK